MLSPGSATALVNSALEWLQPQVIQALTSSLPDPRADPESNPRPDPDQGNGRQGRTAAAAAPGALCSALAAVLQFLGAHIQARQVHLHACLFGQCHSMIKRKVCIVDSSRSTRSVEEW